MKTKSLDFPTASDVNDKYTRKPQLRDVNIDDVPEKRRFWWSNLSNKSHSAINNKKK